MRKILALIMTFAMVMTAFTVAPIVSAKKTEAPVKSGANLSSPSDFTWDNASVYFLLTDRFYNGDTSNDHSYERGLEKDGTVTKKMNSDAASFQGGDFAGITKKINEGYFTDLGVNALWISAPYEQILGYSCAGSSKSAFPHYSYHGYYVGDYSNFDQNFGTEQEFQTLVDAAHEKGIRVVIDVVMNHPGYNTMYDMNKFGFGDLKTGWDSEYYSFSGNNNTYHKYIDYDNALRKEELTEKWGKWWGKSWIRAGLMGYTNYDSSDLKGSAGGDLADFITEGTEEVSLPVFLENKWKSEGNYDSKMADMNQWFSQNNYPKTVRYYLCYWLSRYVERYGVDGFRCDTAKHVELESWAALKDICVNALENWRKNNPDKPGADWDESFWMTGEVFGKNLSGADDPYFAQGKFDSTINFSFSGTGVNSVSGVNQKYEDYAKNINTSDSYNVLSYISSHDTSLCGRDRATVKHDTQKLIYQGSALQLLPGAIQIYYGDESGREYLTSANSSISSVIQSGNHHVRSFMNWDTTDNEILSHWQKVGKFRNSHVAIGAGTHKSLTSTSGAAFMREYNKNGVQDKVLCCIGAEPNTQVTVQVDSADFPEGTLIKNTYDGSTAVVYHNKVKMNVGATGTILGEVAGTGQVTAVSEVVLDKTSATLEIGKNLTLSAQVKPENATDGEVVWESDNANVAKVENGVVTGIKAGTAVISATADGVKAECKVTVKKSVTSVKLNTTKKTLYTKQSLQLRATVNPSDATNKAVTWSSSNSRVASVSSTGRVTAKAKGTAVITVKSRDNGRYARCTLTVKQRVTKVKLTLAKKSVKVKKSFKIKATAYPNNANVKNIKWTLNKKNIVKISKKATASGKAIKVTAKKKGNVTLKATAADGSKKSASCKITVKKK